MCTQDTRHATNKSSLQLTVITHPVTVKTPFPSNLSPLWWETITVGTWQCYGNGFFSYWKQNMSLGWYTCFDGDVIAWNCFPHRWRLRGICRSLVHHAKKKDQFVFCNVSVNNLSNNLSLKRSCPWFETPRRTCNPTASKVIHRLIYEQYFGKNGNRHLVSL